MRLFIVVYEIYFSCALLFIYFNLFAKYQRHDSDSNNQKIANATLLFKEASNLNSIKEYEPQRNIFVFVKERVSKLGYRG
jgi:hypothetical protein